LRRPIDPIGHQDHNDWIEKEDFDIFLHAILMTHPGLEFLLETQAGDGLAVEKIRKHRHSEGQVVHISNIIERIMIWLLLRIV
jgi:hypothetical protein